jgi:hypothetical protein
MLKRDRDETKRKAKRNRQDLLVHVVRGGHWRRLSALGQAGGVQRGWGVRGGRGQHGGRWPEWQRRLNNAVGAHVPDGNVDGRGGGGGGGGKQQKTADLRGFLVQPPRGVPVCSIAVVRMHARC